MKKEQLLELGIEIVAAMKASCYNCDIEIGRDIALEETEIERMEGYKHWNSFDKNTKLRYKDAAKREKKRLHKQALYVAKITLEKFEAMGYATNLKRHKNNAEQHNSEI